MNTMRVLAAVPALLLSSFLHAELLVEDAWVRGLPPGVANTSAYMTLRNPSGDDVVLTGASSPLAGQVQLHMTANHDGTLHMTHVETLTIPARDEVRLQSGGIHLMLMQLKSAPVTDSEVELTLHFDDGTSQTLQLPVRSVLDE